MPPPPAVPFQVASLVNAPSFPNAVVWSDDNLLAVATGDIITILNPDNVRGPRGVITLAAGLPFPVGVIDRADLHSGCLLPTCLARDRQPCVRSLSWSPVGYTPCNGCLLAVCSTEGCVKVYRKPSFEFQAEWVEVIDISDLLLKYLAKINYGEPASLLPVMDDLGRPMLVDNDAAAEKTSFTSTKENKRIRDDVVNLGESSCTQKMYSTYDTALCESSVVNAVAESVVFPSSLMQEGSPVEVFNMDGEQHFWRAGRLSSFEGSRVLVQFCEAEGNEEQWFEMDSMINMTNQPNHHTLPTVVQDYSFPQIRPSMNVAHLPDQICSLKHKVGEMLEARQVIETWTRDRWLEGVFLGFADGSVLVKLGDVEAVSLHPSEVRFPPLWNAQEKSWNVTVIRVLHTQELSEVVVNKTCQAKENRSSQAVPAGRAKRTSIKRKRDNHTDYVLTAHQYASRSSMLASLVVAWSPVLQFSTNDPYNSCDSFCLLAVGTKSGTISIWRFNRPSYNSVEHHDDPKRMNLVGVLHAHSAWVTALSWDLLASDSSPQQVILVSGCSDSSTKIWLAHASDFERSFDTNQAPFSLFSEITAGDKSLVSTLSLYIPAQPPQKNLVAVGKGSGSFDVWSFNRETKSPKKVGSCNAHMGAVTGLAWAFDGHCLYSCSQDNSLYGWIHHKGALFEAALPPNNLGTRSFSNLPSVSDSSYGVAVSPSNLALAVVRRFDAGQLDHMYQKRTQRAAVEFFWIGGQGFNMPLHINLTPDIQPCPGFTKEELVSWGSKLLWSLNKYSSCDKQLVAWDLLAAVLAFKQCAPEFIKNVILSWLKLLLEGYWDSSTGDILSVIPQHMSQLSSRQLHLFNILCRRVIVSSGSKGAKRSAKPQNLSELYDMEEEEMWLSVMSNSEKELRERLVGLSLSTVLFRLTNPAPKVESWLWSPTGIAQMVKWVMQNQNHVHNNLNLLAKVVRGHAARLPTVCDYIAEERCYCSAAIPFESPEAALCKGVQCGEGEAPQQHKQARCSVSMQVCPLTTLWFCMCCQRRASNLPPHQLHGMVGYPSDFTTSIKPLVNRLPNPLCPFCGISLQRPQPDFLLSVSLV